MLADMNTSRARMPTDPSVSPNAVQEVTLTTTMTASAGRLDAGGSKSSSSHPIRKPHAETSTPLAITGTARPMKTAIRLAGVASKGASVWYWRSFAIVIVPAKTADIADAWIALPTTKNASSSTLLNRPR
jgi:hypothetical protein